MRKSGWLLVAITTVLAAMTVWVLSAFWLNTAFADANPLRVSIRSKLAADYSRDPNQIKLGPFRLSIIREAIEDLGIGDPSIRKLAADQLPKMEGLVPTATALNFEGDPPLTATVTASPVTTATPELTKTPEPTGSLVRNQSTKTPTPTKQVVSAATVTSGSCCDSVKPTLSGAMLIPTPGALSSCTVDIEMNGLRVKDPAPSSGIDWVKVKYKIEGPGSLGYVYTADFSPPDSGGWSGNSWDAYYSGMFTVDFDSAYAEVFGGSKALALAAAATPTPTPIPPTATYTPLPPTPTYTPLAPTATATPAAPTATYTPTATPTPFTVKLWAAARDNDGNINYLFLGSYSMPAACD